MPRTKADRKASGAKKRVSSKSTASLRPKKAKAPETEKSAKAEQPSRSRGGQTVYTTDLADAICKRLAMGESLIGICRDEGMPAESTVRDWALDVEHPFAAKYARAREFGYMRMADELVDILDDGRNDWMRRNGGDEDAGWVANGENISRSRLRFEGRKWILSKALPKIYGDKVALTDADGGKLVVTFAQ